MRSRELVEHLLGILQPRGSGVFPVAPALAARAACKAVLGLLARGMESIADDGTLAASPWEASSVWTQVRREYLVLRERTLEVLSWGGTIDPDPGPAPPLASTPEAATDTLLALLEALGVQVQWQDQRKVHELAPEAFAAFEVVEALLRVAAARLASVPWATRGLPTPPWLDDPAPIPSRTPPVAV